MKPNVIFDARMVNRTGIGRYVDAIGRSGSHPELSFCLTCLVHEHALIPEARQYRVSSPVFSSREQLELPFAIRACRGSLFHSPQFNFPLLADIPGIVTVHDCALSRMPEEAPNGLALSYYKVMMKAATKRARLVVAVSESTKRDLVQFFGADPERIRVIHCGIDLDSFQCAVDPSKVAQVRAKYGLFKPYGLYVGLTRPRKNLLNLLRAVRLVVDRLGREFQMAFVGRIDTRYLNLAALIDEYQLNDVAVQTGIVGDDELLSLYRGAAFFAFPSTYEGFGLPVLEAMAAGIPVLTSNASSLPEVAGDAALFVDPVAVDSITDGIIALLSDSELARHLVEKGKDRVKDFSWDRTVRQTFELYRSILDDR